MQIFVLSKNPVIAAKLLWRLSPIRARKMITESQQILACINAADAKPPLLTAKGFVYKTPPAIQNHPITKWVFRSGSHAYWLYVHLCALYSRYDGDGFENVPENLDRLQYLTMFSAPFNSINFINFAKSDEKNLDFTFMLNTVEAYNLYLLAQLEKEEEQNA